MQTLLVCCYRTELCDKSDDNSTSEVTEEFPSLLKMADHTGLFKMISKHIHYKIMLRPVLCYSMIWFQSSVLQYTNDLV